MSLPVAIQSVVFYYLSCATCNKALSRRKTKVRAERDRAEKQQIETEQPGLYRHPSPFHTNPFWEVEIALGPNPKSKKKGGESTKALNDSDGAGMRSSVGTGGSSIPSTAEGSRISGEGWNRKPYQRPNELLWGLDLPGPRKIKDAITRAGSTTKQLFEHTLTGFIDHDHHPNDSNVDVEREKNKSYFRGRNPPVNDLHPPVVTTTPANHEENSWMMQPPPPAKVMEGKERVASLRSRADSGASSRKVEADTPLSRRATEKLTASRLNLGVTEEMHELRPSSSRLSSRPATRVDNLDGSSSESESVGSGRNMKGMSVTVPYPTMAGRAVLKPDTQMRERPKLEQILSSSMAIPQVQSFQSKGDALQTVADSTAGWGGDEGGGTR
ncbi:hypothetical protein BJ878DRAFT_536684 [Calycina marina]|uniref:Signal peptide-containing protein n=1 Tax=Calycina marina TaxID=1763456 RepID=A0A9P8CC24_9HELO|nr:hypothetical protein BJ878DRAFT_536684 [Calycina marina]